MISIVPSASEAVTSATNVSESEVSGLAVPNALRPVLVNPSLNSERVYTCDLDVNSALSDNIVQVLGGLCTADSIIDSLRSVARGDGHWLAEVSSHSLEEVSQLDCGVALVLRNEASLLLVKREFTIGEVRGDLGAEG